MNPRTTLLLALILAGLGAYLYLVEFPREAAQSAGKLIVSFDKEKVSAIRLSYPERKITLKKAGENWLITEPIEADADGVIVSNLINAIASAEASNTYDDPGEDLSLYGLDKPQATVTLTLDDGSSLPEIKIGKKTAVGYSTYVTKGDDGKVYVTSASFHTGMDKRVKDLREKRLLVFEDDEVRKIAIVEPAEGTVELSKEGGKWEIKKPAEFPADTGQVGILLSSLGSLRANDFVTDSPKDLARYGLDKPQLTVSLFFGKDLARKAVLLGKQIDDAGKKGFYAKREAKETIYSVPDYALKNLSKDLSTLRDKAVFYLDAKTVHKVVVARVDGKGFTLLREKEDKWKLEGKTEGKVREYAVSHFAQDVVALKGSDIAADSPQSLEDYGLHRPQVKVSLYDAEKKLLGTVIGAKKDSDEIYIMRQGGSTVYGARSYVFARIDKKLSDMVEPPPAKENTAAQEGVQEGINDPGEKERLD